jgi:glycosyltransferase involved in cell wall biosynthesis
LQLFGKKQCNAQIKTIRCSACYASQRNNLFKSFSGAILASVLPQSPLKNKLPALNLIPNKKHSMHYLAQYTHQCIAIAHWIENAFKINGIEQVTTLTQAIDTSFFTPQLNSPDKNKIQIGFIGRMNPSKGFQLVLDALEKNNLYEKFELHVITIKDKSEPDFYTEMKNRFKDLGYTNWQEQLSHNQINKEMDNWNLLILPSIANEAAPLVILEAFAKGIPGIGSDYPAIAEMIFHNKNGWLFKNGNSIDLYSLLSELNKDRINKAKENIKAPKDIKELVDEHESLYQSYLNN